MATTQLPEDPLPCLKVGEGVPGFMGRPTYTVTDADLKCLIALRAALIVTAWRRSTLHYEEAGGLIGRPGHFLTRLLDLLSVDCKRRVEPSLAALVVNKATGQCGDGFAGDGGAERQLCYQHWSE